MYLFALACLWLSCCLLLLLYNSVESSCRALLPIGISSYIYLLAPWCVSVAPCGILCVVSSYILLYRLVACNWLYLLACLVGRLSWSVVPAGYSCRWSYRLVAPPAVGRRACSLLLSVVLSCLLLWSCYLIARSGHRLAPPLVPSGGPIPDPQEGGGGFFKKCVGVDRNPPRPHFYARGRKKCDFQAQNRGNPRKKRVKILERLDEVKE